MHILFLSQSNTVLKTGEDLGFSRGGGGGTDFETVFEKFVDLFFRSTILNFLEGINRTIGIAFVCCYLHKLMFQFNFLGNMVNLNDSRLYSKLAYEKSKLSSPYVNLGGKFAVDPRAVPEHYKNHIWTKIPELGVGEAAPWPLP